MILKHSEVGTLADGETTILGTIAYIGTSRGVTICTLI